MYRDKTRKSKEIETGRERLEEGERNGEREIRRTKR